MQKLGPEYHQIWEDGDFEKVARRAQAVAQPGFVLWSLLNYGLYLAVIGALAAVAYIDHSLIALIGLVCLAAALLLKSAEKLPAYEYAVQLIWEGRVAYQQGDEDGGWDLVQEAIRAIRPDVIIARPKKEKAD